MLSNIKLKDYVPEDAVKYQNFLYGKVKGFAEILGWQIVVFRENDNENTVSALSLEGFENSSELKKIANKLLEDINLSVRLGDNFNLVKKHFGKNLFLDEIIDNVTRYYYLKYSCLFCFGVDKENLVCSVEIIKNKNIINERMDYIN